jgi:hypothetical protein
MKRYHGDPRFYNILKELADIHSRKNHDYSGDDPLSNLKLSERMGIPAWKGVLVRMSDKISRLWNCSKMEQLEVSDESIIDTLKDLAVYSILCILLYEDSKKVDNCSLIKK